MNSRIWILGAADPEMNAIDALLRECGERVAYAVSPDSDLCGTGETGAPIPRVSSATSYEAVYAVDTERRPHGECNILASAEHGSWIGDGCSTIYLVECGVDRPAYEKDPDPDGEDHSVCVVRVDPDCSRPPSEYLSASSIGQVIAELARLRRLPWTYHAYETRVFGAGAILRMPHASRGGDPVGSRADEPSERADREWVVSTPARGDMCYLTSIPPDLVLVAGADHCLTAAYRGECQGVEPDARALWLDGETK